MINPKGNMDRYVILANTGENGKPEVLFSSMFFRDIKEAYERLEKQYTENKFRIFENMSQVFMN
jgi:hypothetical protein